jgi:riboflavin kinase/FMN adenylyltransferase
MPQLVPVASPPSTALRGGAYALGNFDGVHLGHQAVIKAAIDKARGLGIPARVLTFEPHPRSVLKPHIPLFRLTPAPAKLRIMKALGVDDVIVRPFTPEFSQLGATDFVQQVLLGDCGAQHVVAGFDFVFGHARGGDIRKLRGWLAPHNVGVTEVTPFRDAKGVLMSSTRAREALQEGDLPTARHILGRPWSIAGIVQHGDRRGHQLSVPTANIALADYMRPKFGVYAVHAGRVNEPKRWQGVANIGVRPTIGAGGDMLEFHLFNFDEDIYGEEWEVELIAFLRPERRFSDMETLRAQIMQDIEDAKARLTLSARGQ